MLIERRALGSANRQNKVRDLFQIGGDQNQPFVPRTTLQAQDFLHRATIARVTTQAITRLGGIGDHATAFEVGA